MPIAVIRLGWCRGRRLLRFTALVAALSMAFGTTESAGAQQWSVQASDAPQRWRVCRIAATDYFGPCRVTFLTKGDRAINIHFDLDASGVQGLSFVIPSDDLELLETMPFTAVAQRFQRNNLEPSNGSCAFRADTIRCISLDGSFSAEAVQRLD